MKADQAYNRRMLFLLNDALIALDAHDEPPIDPARFRALSLSFLLRLGAEMFAEEPLLHKTNPERAKRLATLIRSKSPQVNAALFVAPANNWCRERRPSPPGSCRRGEGRQPEHRRGAHPRSSDHRARW